jgi:hypothetical protein
MMLMLLLVAIAIVVVDVAVAVVAVVDVCCLLSYCCRCEKANQRTKIDFVDDG